MRKKETFDPQEPVDVPLKTIQHLRKRFNGDTRQISYKYQSELFIVSILLLIQTQVLINIFNIQLLYLFLGY